MGRERVSDEAATSDVELVLSVLAADKWDYVVRSEDYPLNGPAKFVIDLYGAEDRVLRVVVSERLKQSKQVVVTTEEPGWRGPNASSLRLWLECPGVDNAVQARVILERALGRRPK